jgi:putative MATE family efflux protein
MEKRHILANDNILKLLFKLSTPATIGMAAMAMFNIVDTIFVGRGIGSLAIAALSIVFPIQMFLLAVGQMIGIGAASLISRSLGANDYDKANKTLGNVVLIVISFALIITVLGSVFITELLTLFGATDTIIGYAKDYMQVILFGSLFFIFLVTGNNIIRSEGKAKIAMTTMLVAAGINIILDPIFIFALNLGIRGAALATIISQFITAMYIFRFFIAQKSILVFRVKDIIPDLKIIKEIFAVGISAFSQQVAASILIIVINNSLGYYGGEIYIAVYGIINRLLRFVLMPIFGIAQGMQPIAGFNYGRKDYRKSWRAIKLAIIAATTVSTLGFIILMTIPNILIGIFTTDAELIDKAVRSLRLMIMVFPIVGYQIVSSVAFQAMGKALPALVLSLSRQIILLIPLVLILPRLFDVYGIWIAFPISDVLATMITSILIFKQYREMKKDFVYQVDRK